MIATHMMWLCMYQNVFEAYLKSLRHKTLNSKMHVKSVQPLKKHNLFTEDSLNWIIHDIFLIIGLYYILENMRDINAMM